MLKLPIMSFHTPPPPFRSCTKCCRTAASEWDRTAQIKALLGSYRWRVYFQMVKHFITNNSHLKLLRQASPQETTSTTSTRWIQFENAWKSRASSHYATVCFHRSLGLVSWVAHGPTLFRLTEKFWVVSHIAAMFVILSHHGSPRQWFYFTCLHRSTVGLQCITATK